MSKKASGGRSRAPGAKAGVRLTGRERQVAEAIADGLSDKQIAARLHIAMRTVKSHVRGILEKLTLRAGLEFAARAPTNRAKR